MKTAGLTNKVRKRLQNSIFPTFHLKKYIATKCDTYLPIQLDVSHLPFQTDLTNALRAQKALVALKADPATVARQEKENLV